MKRIYICSKYKADKDSSVEKNIKTAFTACGIALSRGYAPIAPHLIYPKLLDDNDSKKRAFGLAAAKAWISVCDEVWQWGTSISEGMEAELKLAKELDIPIKIFNILTDSPEYNSAWQNEVEVCNSTDA